MTNESVQTMALIAIAVGVLWSAAGLHDIRKDVAEIWKRMKRLD